MDRRVDRLGDDAVGSEEEHPRDLVRHRAALDRVAEHDRRAQQQADLRVLEDRPSRQPQQPVHLRVAASQAGPQPEPLAMQRDARNGDEGGHS